MAGSRSDPLERDTVRDLVLPGLRAAGWQETQIIREYYLQARRTLTSDGAARELGRGFADVVLQATPGTAVAVVEAKRRYRTADDAIQQAIRYAIQLDAPLAYGTNGGEIIEHNLRTGAERRVESFPAPATAWGEYVAANGLDEQGAELIAQPFNRLRLSAHGDVIEPRPYQATAINRVLMAIAQGEQRVLLLMATGTGKTFTAMQIVAKLRGYHRVATPDRNYRVLYLADRDALLSQPMSKDFTPAFGSDPLRRVLGNVDHSREIYFASYQSLVDGGDDSRLEQFRPDFFDLVIIDECHRGSADENSAWRVVLDRFSSAVQLGLTATPRDDTVRSYEYFGNPVFEYSLRQGIADGYLAPYRVRRVVLTPDADGWEPTPGERDRFGREVPDGLYTTKDFERTVALLARTRLAARHLSRLLRRQRFPRAIVFCVDTEHASAMRSALAEENQDLVLRDPDWVVRIVGEEPEKERLLEEFRDPERSVPAVATTSRLLSTGVDVEDLTHVVLFRPVGSMVEFKQIIGRGTRLYPEKGKTSFEIVDYVGASEKFNDPDFDGYPEHITLERIDTEGDVIDTVVDGAPAAGDGVEPDIGDGSPWVHEHLPDFRVIPGSDDPVPGQSRVKYFIDGDEGFVVESETRLVPSVDSGKLVLTEFGALMRDRIRALGGPDELRREWTHAASRQRLKETLEAADVDLDDLAAATGIDDIDPLDALHHLAWNLPTRTRAERAKRVREQHDAELRGLEREARAILEGLLQRYEEHGIDDLDSLEVFRLQPLRGIGSASELARIVGGPQGLRDQLQLVQEWLYSA